MTCIDLHTLFDDRFKLDVDESYYAERSEFRSEAEPWLTHVLCRHGHIGVWGADQLFASTTTTGPVATRLKTLPFIEVVQDGIDGVTVTFRIGHLDEIAQIIRPRRRRRLSPEQRARLVEAGARYRFSVGAQSDSEAQFCDAPHSRG